MTGGGAPSQVGEVYEGVVEDGAGKRGARETGIVGAMHYFTRELADGELAGGDTEDDARRAEYQARVAAVEAGLPADLVRLAKETNLHDGLIECIRWSPSRRRLVFNLVIENLQLGYSAAELSYGGVLLGGARLEALRRAAESRETEILFDEVDLDEGGMLVHRILFWPSEQVTLEFDSFTLKVEPRPDRRVDLLGPFLIEEEED